MVELYHLYKLQQQYPHKRQESIEKRVKPNADAEWMETDGGAAEDTSTCVDPADLQQKLFAILFTLLDYPQWNDQAAIWELLATELEADCRLLSTIIHYNSKFN